MPIIASAQEILTAAGAELGLAVGTIGLLQTGNTGEQALALLNAIGDECVKVHDWQMLEKTAEFTGDGTLFQFDLPMDFGRVVNQTEWSSRDKRPMSGPMTPQTWSWAQYGIVATGIFFRYRILANKFTTFPTAGPGETFHLFYISKNWVYDPISQTYKDTITLGTDQPVFDRRLMISALKLKLWEQKGFDTTKLVQEFNYNLETEKSQNQGASQISLVGSVDTFFINPLLNVPDGSW
jgi:hypothetical protein